MVELQSFDELNNFPWKQNIESDFGNMAGFLEQTERTDGQQRNGR